MSMARAAPGHRGFWRRQAGLMHVLIGVYVLYSRDLGRDRPPPMD